MTLKYNIVKNDTDYDPTEMTELTESDLTSKSENSVKYESIVNSKYKNPKEGSKQSKLTKAEIKEKLIGYKTLNKKDYNYLLTLPVFKTWIKYYNHVTKQFRVGGLLMKVDPELRFITLVNTGIKKSWSVQLQTNENIIFVPEPSKRLSVTVKDDEPVSKAENKKRKDYIIKEKLYKMYLDGKLQKNKQPEPEMDPEKIKECATKEKLYKLYNAGKLKRI
jgi:hypothetical protein